MNVSLVLTGADAPDIAIDGARLTLTYATLAQYTARVAADDAAVRALPDVVAVESWLDEIASIGTPVGSGRQRLSYALAPAPVAPKSPVTEQPKPRR